MIVYELNVKVWHAFNQVNQAFEMISSGLADLYRYLY